MFKYNNLNIEYALEDNGYGTVSFFGISLLVNGCIFQYNQNVQGAGIYIDGTSNMHATMVEITNTCFYSNVAITGAGISMGYSILEIAATLNNVTCFNNSVSESNFLIKNIYYIYIFFSLKILKLEEAFSFTSKTKTHNLTLLIVFFIKIMVYMEGLFI